MFGKIKCSNCGALNDKKSTFCLQCGSPLSGTTCSSCGKPLGQNVDFCPHCGARISDVAERRGDVTPVVEEKGKVRAWQRNPNDFARRFEVSDIKGLFSKKITVMSGTKALFLQGGRFSGELPPGTYTVGGLTQVIKTLNLAEKATVILVDDADVGLDFSIGSLRTKENFDAGVKGRIVVNTEEPILLFNNLMKGREHVAATELEALLRNEMLNVLQSKLRQYSFEELYGNLDLKKELEQDFEHQLSTTLSRVGLKLVHMPYFDYDESYWKVLIEKGARIGKEGAKLGLEEQEEGLEDKRLGLTKRMRARLTDDTMNEFQNAEDLEKFVYELDKDKVIRDNEMIELKQIFDENREDRKLARERMLDRIELEHAVGLKRTGDEYSREKIRKDAEARREIERQEDLEDFEAAKRGISIVEQMKNTKREDAAGYQALELEKLQKEAELEVERLKARSAATDEALISMADDRQAEHLSEVARMKAATGLTEEQILALGAKDSAAVADAFKEKYKSMSTEQIMKMYEARLGDKDNLAQVIQEISDKGGDRMERMAAKALEQMGITASTRAQGAAPGGTTVVTGSGGGMQPVVIGGAPQAVAPPVQDVKKVVICPECNAELPVGTRFCTNCGAKIGKKE
jgi:ribosomal protein L40E